MAHTRPWAIALVAFCTLLTAAGQLLFKLGLNAFVPTFWGVVTNYHLLLGFFMYGIGAILLVIALKYGELSVLYPVVALSFVWVLMLSVSFLDEPVGILRSVGVASILLGVSAIGKGSRGGALKLR
ncbi:MAG: EamA/RhaT family transporter [Candidatus Woesearchaeota archaeon]